MPKQPRWQWSSYARQSAQIGNRRRRRYSRFLAIRKLGGCCLHCGIKDLRVLEIDHITGDGDLERPNGRGNAGTFQRKQIQLILKTPLSELADRYQILCANCHRIKTYENQDYLPSEPGAAKQQSLFQQY